MRQTQYYWPQSVVAEVVMLPGAQRVHGFVPGVGQPILHTLLCILCWIVLYCTY
jgi:hypothetical protein